MIKLVVLYGHPTDSAAFDKYYHETHIPIARNIPNVKRAELGRIHSAMPGETPPTTGRPSSGSRARSRCKKR